MKLIDIFEAASAELYHSTRLFNAAKILNSGYFVLAASTGTPSERQFQKPGKFYYLSTTRSKVGDYTLHNYHIDGVVFNLNGNWLNQHYTSAPVDYWERSWERSGGTRTSEAEDRVYSTEPTIPLPKPATKLITSIHVLFEIDKIKTSLDQDRLLHLRKVLFEAKKLNIPIYVYKTPNDWITQNTKKRIATGSLIKLMKPGPNEKPWSSIRRDYLKPWRELYFKNNKDDLSKEGRDFMWRLFRNSTAESNTSLSADIHNLKSKNDPGLIKLLQIFNKLKINNPVDYVSFLKDKWEKIIDNT